MTLGELVRAARASGWTVEPTAGGRLRWTPPAGRHVTSRSRAIGRGLLNVRAALRRAGLRV